MVEAEGGKVEALWLKRAIRGPMDAVDEAVLVAGEGLEGDANRGRSQRQVTIIEREVFDLVRAELPDASPSMRRANVMVSGISLARSRDAVLSVGEAKILIRGETRPCERMDAQCDGLTSTLDQAWRGGAYGVVLEGGRVHVGDPASLDPAD
jgi:MOSC domain-containing protein YiiM